MNSGTIYRRSLLTLGLLAMLLVAAPAALTKPGNPGVLPPHAHAFGRSYGEWGAAWWRWIYAQRISANAAIDETGQHCAAGQAGKVWFLAGTFLFPVSGTPTVTRACTIPSGKALFVPLLNGEWDNVTVSGPPATLTIAELTAACEAGLAGLGGAGGLSAEVDGRTINHLADYAVKPTLFWYTMPAGDDSVADFFGYPDFEGVVPPPGAVSCGSYLMLAPLPKGEHTVHFAVAGLLDVTYHLTVGTHEQSKSQMHRAMDARVDRHST